MLLAHDATQVNSDLFQMVVTMLDPRVVLDLVVIPAGDQRLLNAHDVLQQDQEQAARLGRQLRVYTMDSEPDTQVVRLAREGHYDLIILALPEEQRWQDWAISVRNRAHCPVFFAVPPAIPREV